MHGSIDYQNCKDHKNTCDQCKVTHASKNKLKTHIRKHSGLTFISANVNGITNKKVSLQFKSEWL